MAGRRKASKTRRVDTLTHGGARRRNVPTAEAQPLMACLIDDFNLSGIVARHDQPELPL